jgi:putative hydrolase of the HAD superfamily
MIQWIGFDADDTLWHNETLFNLTQDRYTHLLSGYHPAVEIEKRLFETEMRNLKDFGYGIKGFVLSMIETAIQLTENRVSAGEIQEIINLGKSMMRAPVELLDHARQTVEKLSQSYPLLMITKGDLFDQESKIARSGLIRYFRGIEILTEKTPATYRAVLNKYGIDPASFLMVGNSLKSDILPVLAIGGQAVQVEYSLCWEHEKVNNEDLEGKPFHRLDSLAGLVPLIESLAS